MAKFKIEDREIAAPESLFIGEILEVEHLLGIRFEESSGFARMTCFLYAAMRRAEPNRSAEEIAEDVKRADIMDFEFTEDDAIPPAEGAKAPESPGEQENAATAEEPSTKDGLSEPMESPAAESVIDGREAFAKIAKVVG